MVKPVNFSLSKFFLIVSATAVVIAVFDQFRRHQFVSSLVSAVKQNDVDRVDQILSLEPSLKAKADSWSGTPLMYAAANGSLECVKLLVEKHGCSIDERSRKQRTPLMWAALNGHSKVTRYLLQAGAATDLVDRDGMTAGALAKQKGMPCVNK